MVMNSIFDHATRQKLIGRINMLTETSQAAWGKMNVSQMLKHCILCEEMYLGKRNYKRAFLGRLFGQIAIKNLTKDDRPLKHNSPTSPAFIIKEVDGDVQTEKLRWIALMEEYGRYDKPEFVHWFFGKMS